MSQPEMPRAPGDGLELQLARWPGPGPALLAVHGLTANCRCWDTMARELGGQRELLALDLRGRGRSDKPASGYSLEHHCADIDAMLDHLGHQRVGLMGHSLGAYISLAYAATRPQRVERLILMDGGAVLSPEQWARVGEGIAPSLERLDKMFASCEEMISLSRGAPFLQPWNQALEDYYSYDCQEAPGGVVSSTSLATTQQERANLNQVDVGGFYPRVSCPVLVLRATQGVLAPDQMVLPPDATANLLAALPQAELADMEGLNHFTIIFHPNAERKRAVEDFLAA